MVDFAEIIQALVAKPTAQTAFAVTLLGTIIVVGYWAKRHDDNKRTKLPTKIAAGALATVSLTLGAWVFLPPSIDQRSPRPAPAAANQPYAATPKAKPGSVALNRVPPRSANVPPRQLAAETRNPETADSEILGGPGAQEWSIAWKTSDRVGMHAATSAAINDCYAKTGVAAAPYRTRAEALVAAQRVNECTRHSYSQLTAIPYNMVTRAN
jgi:hypothetical protein